MGVIDLLGTSIFQVPNLEVVYQDKPPYIALKNRPGPRLCPAPISLEDDEMLGTKKGIRVDF